MTPAADGSNGDIRRKLTPDAVGEVAGGGARGAGAESLFARRTAKTPATSAMDKSQRFRILPRFPITTPTLERGYNQNLPGACSRAGCAIWQIAVHPVAMVGAHPG
jgi:hypothetical protein